MSRKSHAYHVIYKTTNLLNGKYYVGMHSTSNLDDGYLGSGKRLRYAIRKHGPENFRFEAIEYLPDRESLVRREREIVTDELLNDPMCMNLQPGGGGGFIDTAHMKKCSDAGHAAMRVKLQIDTEFRTKFCQTVSKNNTIKYANGVLVNFKYSWLGKHHRKESIQKQKKTFADNNHQQGEKNSQFGTCWITNDIKNKKIKRTELSLYESIGWKLGRQLI